MDGHAPSVECADVSADPVEHLVDLDRYDLDDAALHDACHRQLTDEGVCILPGLVRSDAIDGLVAECDRLAPLGHRSCIQGTPYLGLPDESYPEGHPRRALVDNALEAVAYDRFPTDSSLRRLYESDRLLHFVEAVLQRGSLHRYADPFGALNLAVMRDGDELGWHFDQTDFVVSIAIQSSLGGGEFENAARIRSATDECFDDVSAVLVGAADHRVRVEPMTPGTLMLFNGRWSLHRVSPVVGPVPRYVALLAYDTKPGTDSTDLLKLVRYGRLPEPV
jgi:hypothetical protein